MSTLAACMREVAGGLSFSDPAAAALVYAGADRLDDRFSDDELPGMWERADFEGGASDVVRSSRIPGHLTGSDRPGGGDPLGDYLHLKGEGRDW